MLEGKKIFCKCVPGHRNGLNKTNKTDRSKDDNTKPNQYKKKKKKKKRSLMKESADFNGTLVFSKRTESMLEEKEMKRIIISEKCVYFNNSLWLF